VALYQKSPINKIRSRDCPLEMASILRRD